MSKITINDTPIRTSRNFKINNITIDAPEIPEKIKEFENVEIKSLSTICDKNVDNHTAYIWDRRRARKRN